ncbi:hypothetical protein [Cobetia crustatorum]|uniref:hypothetical protein n=1 Tax=Cobetia crustatorum TaxID=553385 RepID=UPI0004B91576
MTQETSGQAQLALLGHFQLTLGDDTLTQFSYDKVKALLLHLLLHDQAVSRAVWPNCSGQTKGYPPDAPICATRCIACVKALAKKRTIC